MAEDGAVESDVTDESLCSGLRGERNEAKRREPKEMSPRVPQTDFQETFLRNYTLELVAKTRQRALFIEPMSTACRQHALKGAFDVQEESVESRVVLCRRGRTIDPCGRACFVTFRP